MCWWLDGLQFGGLGIGVWNWVWGLLGDYNNGCHNNMSLLANGKWLVKPTTPKICRLTQRQRHPRTAPFTSFPIPSSSRRCLDYGNDNNTKEYNEGWRQSNENAQILRQSNAHPPIHPALPLGVCNSCSVADKPGKDACRCLLSPRFSHLSFSLSPSLSLKSAQTRALVKSLAWIMISFMPWPSHVLATTSWPTSGPRPARSTPPLPQQFPL